MASTLLGSQYIPVYCTSLPATSLPCSWPKIACRTLEAKARFLFVTMVGYIMHFCLFHYVTGLSVVGAIFCNITVRTVFAIPYIHVNIFEHIGLPMYDVKKRPKRLYQMASSALSLPRNPLLDFSFGHSVISCHVEHHLFPRLSDNMCLKIKPVVSTYLKSNGLPYHEAPYLSLQWKFYNKYDELMVKAPPITELIAIQ